MIRVLFEVKFPAGEGEPVTNADRISDLTAALDEYGPGEIDVRVEPAPGGGESIMFRFETWAHDMHGAINKSLAGLGYMPPHFPDATLLTVSIEPVAPA